MPGISKKTVIDLSKKGSRLFRSGQYEEAKVIYLEAYEIDQENPYVLSGLGDVYRKLCRFEESGKYYDAVLNLDQNNVFALRGAGDARRGLQFPPRDGRLLVCLSEAAFELGAPEEALDLAAEALRVRAEPESFFHLTRTLAMTRRLASNDAERLHLALDRYPGEPALLHAAGVFEAMYGSRDAALRILRSASEREPTSRHHRAIDREIAALEAS